MDDGREKTGDRFHSAARGVFMQDKIIIKGARQHNPRGQQATIYPPEGSDKSVETDLWTTSASHLSVTPIRQPIEVLLCRIKSLSKALDSII